MEYVCSFCRLISEDEEKVRRCETQGSTARYSVDQEVTFVCPILGVQTEIKGVIQEVVHKLRTHDVSYRILAGTDYRLKKHQREFPL